MISQPVDGAALCSSSLLARPPSAHNEHIVLPCVQSLVHANARRLCRADWVFMLMYTSESLWSQRLDGLLICGFAAGERGCVEERDAAGRKPENAGAGRTAEPSLHLTASPF